MNALNSGTSSTGIAIELLSLALFEEAKSSARARSELLSAATETASLVTQLTQAHPSRFVGLAAPRRTWPVLYSTNSSERSATNKMLKAVGLGSRSKEKKSLKVQNSDGTPYILHVTCERIFSLAQAAHLLARAGNIEEPVMDARFMEPLDVKAVTLSFSPAGKWDYWFAVGWNMVELLTEGKPEALPWLAPFGEFNRHHTFTRKADKSEFQVKDTPTQATNRRDGIKRRLREAFQQRFKRGHFDVKPKTARTP